MHQGLEPGLFSGGIKDPPTDEHSYCPLFLTSRGGGYRGCGSLRVLRKEQELGLTLPFFLRRRWMRAASCTVLRVSAWWAGESEMCAIIVVRQLVVARDSRSSMVSLWSLQAKEVLRGWGEGPSRWKAR